MADAALFLRAMRAPLSVADAELEQLTDHQRELVLVRIDVELHAIDNAVRRKAGLDPLPSPLRLSAPRFEEICASLRAGSIRYMDIPLDELRLICAGGQLDTVLAAAEQAEGF